MRSLMSAAILASVFGPLATSAFAADLDYAYPPPPPPPVYEPRPVPPAFIPERVPPVFYRAPVVYPRPVVRVYPRPYPYYGPRPVVRVYPEPRPYPRPYADGGYDRSGEAHPYVDRRYSREAEEYRGRETRGYERNDYREEHEQRYGRYLSHEELDRRAESGHGLDRGGYDRDDHHADRDDRYADREPLSREDGR